MVRSQGFDEERSDEEPCGGSRAATHPKNAAGASGGIYHREAGSADRQKRETTVSGVFGMKARKAASAAR